ncbi:GDSL-type esterase/lipase family protein [Candidatus Enterococcus mansonii]|uniref:SGNH hydrolase-type esterase domain-containing protein n=1 Tax=Candidatus Enterococcus mansonii TaxID=1834181 RepID=A0A242CJH4_9ENTE|nr:GDSL-type esterase/lipase family protein [Enterococcus sp. 4G2_DIV0659]OTO10060.1 hypothetical protein A5880_000743 [Enterococcus sp. 4G2_DIV0659]
MRKREKSPFYKVVWFWLCLILILTNIFFLLKGDYIKRIENKLSNNKIDVVANPEYKRKVSLFKEMPKTDSKIVFLGDSIIAGNNWEEYLGSTKYINRGVSGARIKDLIGELDNLNLYKPEQIILMIGINDVASGNKISDSIEEYLSLIKLLKKKYPKSIIKSTALFHINEKKYEYLNTNVKLNNQLIDQFNDSLESSLPDDITILDINSEISDKNNNLNENLTYDGLHVTEQVYDIWMKKLSLK